MFSAVSHVLSEAAQGALYLVGANKEQEIEHEQKHDLPPVSIAAPVVENPKPPISVETPVPIAETAKMVEKKEDVVEKDEEEDEFSIKKWQTPDKN